jgi:nicotinate-nucleotide--dimethylbenzimidazole phosphoribosyltransferase
MVRFSELVQRLSGDGESNARDGEKATMSDDKTPRPDTPAPTGTPADGPAHPDEGLTPEERAMLDSLSSGGATSPEPAAEPVPEPEAEALPETAPLPREAVEIEEGFTAEEREMLARLRADETKPSPEAPSPGTPPSEALSEIEAAADRPAAEPDATAEAPASDAAAAVEQAPQPTAGPAQEPAPPAVDARPETPPPRSAEGPLTSAEEQVLARARSESQRLARDEVPAMFEPKPEPPPEPAAEEVLVEENLDALEPEADAATTREPGRLAQLLAIPLDWINRPFAWLPPVWRMGLGFCGVLLLITLLLVILVGRL